MECLRSLAQLLPRAVGLPRRTLCALAGARPVTAAELLGSRRTAPLCGSYRLRLAGTALPAPQPRTPGLR